MDLDRYYRSITDELCALKDRVENAIDARHQGEIGSWRESLVRSLLRRHLPATLGVGQGFVVTNDGPTKQLDVIVYDLNYPRIVQEGELIIVTPDAVRAIVEVKSTASSSRVRDDLRLLAQAALACRQDAQVRAERATRGTGMFAGYFAFQRTREIPPSTLTGALRDSVLNTPHTTLLRPGQRRIDQLRTLRENLLQQPELAAINAVALGQAQFVRYWPAEGVNSSVAENQWKSYTLPHLSFGYFVTNLLATVTPGSIRQHASLWWPEDPKRQGVSTSYPRADEFDQAWDPAGRTRAGPPGGRVNGTGTVRPGRTPRGR